MNGTPEHRRRYTIRVPKNRRNIVNDGKIGIRVRNEKKFYDNENSDVENESTVDSAYFRPITKHVLGIHIGRLLTNLSCSSPLKCWRRLVDLL